MSFGKSWSQEDFELLKQKYLDYTPYKEICALFPNRTPNSIYSKITKSGIRRKQNYWTKEELEFVKENSDKMSREDIAKKLGNKRTPDAVESVILNNNFKRRPKTKIRKYTFDSDAFSKLTLEAIYWAGFIAADGCLNYTSKKHSLRFCMGLAIKDIDHLEKLKLFFKYTGAIKRVPSRKIITKNKIYWASPQATLFIHGVEKIKNDLEKFYNIVPQKTKIIKPPNLIDEVFLLTYIIGYIDGDGSIVYRQNRNTIYLDCISSSDNIMIWMFNYLKQIFSYDKEILSTIYKKQNTYRFSFEGIRVAMIVDYLRQFPVPHLSRKWDQPIILERIEKYKQKYPEYFIKTLPDFSKYQ